MSATENYIGFEELVFYLNEPRKISYHGFLKLNQNTIIASLSQLTNFPLEKWQNYNNTWINRFLHNAKKLFDSNTFTELKKKVIEEYQRKKDLQTYWQEVIKEYEESQKIIKEYEKKNMITTVTPLPKSQLNFLKLYNQKKIFLPLLNHILKLYNQIYLYFQKKTGKSSVKNLSETSQLDLFKKNITFINNFCYDVFHELDLLITSVMIKEYCSGKILESIFNEKWNEKIILYDRQTRELKRLKRVKDNDTGDTDRSWKKQSQILEHNKNNLRQTRELKRVRDTDTDDTDDTDRSWKKQCQILEQNKNNLIYRQVINDALLITSAYESLVIGNIIPFIEILKTFLLTRSRMSLSLANESMLQAIIESLLPLKYRIPELSLVMDGKKLKGSGRFGYSDIFVLKGIGDIYYISLELKYIPLVGLIKNQKVKYGANELENLDKILEKENEEDLLKRPYAYWSKEYKRTNQTTIGEVLMNNGISQLESYMNTISKGRVVDYSSSGIFFDERVKIVKSNPNKLKGFVILVIGFRHILWKPVDEVISNYTYNII
ncbi:unnamed protein product [Rhizophagus irregularis]|uniref:Uncharacterized protein n=1 Tax=Rhizophagus irregularis TaxID=588596 RepID=A0A915Z3E3_9GLOM|nr:unnamed protein product [Rhizophagus irregularis]